MLTTSVDPTKDLKLAADQFADDYVPMVFMTGDGHREPPFKWATFGPWADFFREIVDDNNICCHVEKYSDAVAPGCVPEAFAKVFRNGKVFGWEPEVFKVIQSIIQKIWGLRSHLLSEGSLKKSDIEGVTQQMLRVSREGYLDGEGAIAKFLGDKARNSKSDPVPATEIPEFDDLLRIYNHNAMALRTKIHNRVGETIQRRIDEYPDHFHLITCGDAHMIITEDDGVNYPPLYSYVRPPTGCFGVADQMKGI